MGLLKTAGPLLIALALLSGCAEDETTAEPPANGTDLKEWKVELVIAGQDLEVTPAPESKKENDSNQSKDQDRSEAVPGSSFSHSVERSYDGKVQEGTAGKWFDQQFDKDKDEKEDWLDDLKP